MRVCPDGWVCNITKSMYMHKEGLVQLLIFVYMLSHIRSYMYIIDANTSIKHQIYYFYE